MDFQEEQPKDKRQWLKYVVVIMAALLIGTLILSALGARISNIFSNIVMGI